MQEFVEKLEDELQIKNDDEKSLRARQEDLIAAVNRLTRDAELRNEADEVGQPCPACGGIGRMKILWITLQCSTCHGSGQG